MTDSEAIIIAKIMLTADSWCTPCSDALLNQFAMAFAGQNEMIQSIRKSRPDLQKSYYENREQFEEGKSSLLPVWEL